LTARAGRCLDGVAGIRGIAATRREETFGPPKCNLLRLLLVTAENSKRGSCMMLDPRRLIENKNDYRDLRAYREGLYRCFGNGRDTLMNLTDALLTGSQVRSFAELSLSPAFRRRWASIYEVFDDAQVDPSALQKLFASTIPPRDPGARLVLAGDGSPMVRSESPTARDRTYVHNSNMPKGAKPVAPGWQFATIAAMPQRPGSRTIILDNQRVPSDSTLGLVVAGQLSKLEPLVPEDAIVALDGGFGTAKFLSVAGSVRIGKLMRTGKNRRLYRPAPPPTSKAGRPRLDGAPFSIPDANTHGPADDQWKGVDEKNRSVEVECWHNLHFKPCRTVTLSLIRISRPDRPETNRNPRTIWLIWQGANMPPIEQIPAIYRLRYSIEHSYRFDKQNLMWTEPRLRTPEKLQTWTYLVSAVHNEITLAKQYEAEFRLPWANPNVEATPEQVRRGIERIISHLGTPAKPAQPRGKAPGRKVGAVIKKAKRFEVICKKPKMGKKR
jgi:hypothetical protein